MSREDNKNNDDFQENNTPSIKFMKRKFRHRILELLKTIMYVFITVSISIISFIIFFNYKYKDLLDSNYKSLEGYNSNENYYNAVENVKNSLVTVGRSKEALKENEYIEGNMTGIIIEDSGKIITNYSLIKDLKEIYVKLSFVNSEPIKADIIFHNEDIDIAVLKVNSDKALTSVKFAARNEIIEGEKILLISNSTSDEYIDNLVPGIITSSNRQIEVNEKSYNLFEVNTPINEFNTGGIISNLKGELIGIASKKISDVMNIQGLYYVIDLSSTEKIISYTNEIKDILGVIEGEFIEVNNIEGRGGLYITRVNESRNSYKAGLRPTDIIIEIDGQKFNDITEVLNMVKNKENGDTVTCKVMRSGDIIEVDIVLNYINK
ncbi:MAG: serine protease [Clostridium sp.]|uniref:S1C family serine protease n=1 Tax=Clostridium sp. TaxID=1506 RepID=UPI0025BE19F4|nr:S1C family serine protease [Clostridium sp.]MCF0146958.1 serine protease [Clostridium sp.]